MGSKAPLKTGDRVGYSAIFLRSIGCNRGDSAHARGTITAIEDLGSLQLAQIKWDRPGIPERVNVVNLAKPGTAAWSIN